MDLQVHPVCYITCLDRRDSPEELLLVVCDCHRKERQVVEQAIHGEVGKQLATLGIHELRQQPVYTFFEEGSPLNSLPRSMRGYLRDVRAEGDFTAPNGNGGQASP